MNNPIPCSVPRQVLIVESLRYRNQIGTRMALLACCWLIIESIVIPQGFGKWFYLSFYIHPIFLCFCQIFLCIKLIVEWYFLLLAFLWRMVLCILSSCTIILRFLKGLAFFFASPAPAAGGTPVLNEEGALENELQQVTSSQDELAVYAGAAPCHNALCVEAFYRADSILEAKLEDTEAVSLNKNAILIQLDDSYDCCSNSPSSAEVEPDPAEEGSIFSADSPDNSAPEFSLSSSNLLPLELDLHGNELLQPICIPRSPVESEFMDRNEREELDSVYVKYEERMKWFDLLSRDRLYGIDAIQNMQLGRPGLLETLVPAGVSMASTSWSEKVKENLMRSLRSDFELVYVAESCLSWDALHHQYRKVKAIHNSNQNRAFSKETADRFQEFHVLLQRFVEDDNINISGQRHSYYVRRRFSHKKLLQVPTVEYGDKTGEAMNVKATQILKLIENCIQVFWLFVKADTKKSAWKLKNNLSTYPAVEDPRDLELLYDLRKMFRKKEMQLKNLEAKKRCWWRKAVQVQEECHKVDDFLFTMIDLKLVKNVLQMFPISTAQLKWCQKKLDRIRIEIRQRKIYTTSDQQTYLFPSCSCS